MEVIAETKSSIVYFEDEGKRHLRRVVRIVKRFYRKHPGQKPLPLVIFTGFGEGPVEAYNQLQEYDPQIIAVTFPPTFLIKSTSGEWSNIQISSKLRAFFDGVNIKVITGRLPFDEMDGAIAHNEQTTIVSVTESYLAFAERGLTQLHRSRFLGFIIPDAWLSGIKYRDFRKFLGIQKSISRVVDLPYDVFEDAYVDCMVLIVSNQSESCGQVSVSVFEHDATVPEDWRTWPSVHLPYKEWTARIENQLDLRSASSDLFIRMEEFSVPLSQIAEVDRGLEAYGQKTSGDVRAGREYHSLVSRPGANWIPQFTGDLRRYELKLGEPLYVCIGDHLAECPPLEFFTEDRILLRRLISRQFRLMACEVKNSTFANDSSTLNIIRLKGYSPGYVLALLNSLLFSYRQLSLSSIARRDDYPKISLYEARSFPIRTIEFSTPATDRSYQLRQLGAKYQKTLQELPENVHSVDLISSGLSDLLPCIGQLGKSPLVPLDILHDFLSFLAEQMLVFNQRKTSEMGRFLHRLEAQIQPAQKGNGKQGIGSLVGKTVLKDCLGDYEKGEEHVAFDAIWDVIGRNRALLKGKVDVSLRENLRRDYENSLQTLLPIKRDLIATDWLIDQLVYRLYSLTEDETLNVEAKYAQRASLVPRR